ncbi:MAG: cysteine--tRNA ligase [Verrucomicrobia bacterium RIFCSPHIGHO2_12_FULL_41_10]|nr:MAG: cysteine--tRNA ligase [Verrucomicrobia bacterium RIFCSPHIGHO2_12_FULL_41_10]HLB33833.1 cysteine--tRNA ligase [Chthoniobacterales bacterium]
MPLHFYNTLTRQLELFTPLEPEKKSIRLYTCGPTVYDHAHIGNFRAYLFEDLLQRHLESRDHHVHRVMNLTDVDDKTIRGARTQGIALADYTRPYKEAFFADCATLRLRPADSYPAATDQENIDRMISMIKTLVERGHAYQAEDNSIYFRIASFPHYGKLAHVDLQEQRSSHRIKNDEYSKEEAADFALWKAWDPEDGDVYWESPWGRGRPGWHIECSAMATRLLGNQIDIHCGGVDNIFPHHEAEIAQCECVTDQPFVRLWMHCAHLMVDGSKMSKSAGNFYTLRDLIARDWSGREVRYALLTAHYRVPLNFTLEGLEAARQSLQRIDAWLERLHDFTAESKAGSDTPATLRSLGSMDLSGFSDALDDDLNISAALATLFDVIRESNRLLDTHAITPAEVQGLLTWWKKVNDVLAIEPDPAVHLPEEVISLLALRQTARISKNWQESDRLRDQLATLGWNVKDTKTEQKLIKI